MNEVQKDLRIWIQFSEYACFRQGSLDITKNFSIIIGQNNSGKSKLLDILHNITSNDHKAQKPIPNLNCIIKYIINEDVFTENQYAIKRALKNIDNLSGDLLKLLRQFDYFYHYTSQHIIEKDNIISQTSTVLKHRHSVHEKVEITALGFLSKYITIRRPKIILRLAAERNILPEQLSEQPHQKVNLTGEGITSLIASYFHKNRYKDSKAEETILDALNEIIGPDYKFTRIFAYSINEKNDYEINLSYENGNRIALSQQGSGLKTILCVLAYLYLMIDEIDRKETLFLFEELENNLHPHVQKRLVKHIYQYSQRHGCKVFITTHSPFIIDTFLNKNDTQLIVVKKEKDHSTFEVVKDKGHLADTLAHIGIKPSDVLQANFIIWVEGPSDRVYVTRWLELISDGKIVEHEHYECLFYGGSLIAHLTAEDEATQDFINILNINRNAAIMFDSDKKDETVSLKPNVVRIQQEARSIMTWVTDCREVECYIHPELLVNLDPIAKQADLENESVPKAVKRQEIKQPIGRWENYECFYEQQTSIKPMPKVEFAQLIVKMMELKHLRHYDLAEKIEELARRICQVNDLDRETILSVPQPLAAHASPDVDQAALVGAELS